MNNQFNDDPDKKNFLKFKHLSFWTNSVETKLYKQHYYSRKNYAKKQKNKKKLKPILKWNKYVIRLVCMKNVWNENGKSNGLFSLTLTYNRVCIMSYKNLWTDIYMIIIIIKWKKKNYNCKFKTTTFIPKKKNKTKKCSEGKSRIRGLYSTKKKATKISLCDATRTLLNIFVLLKTELWCGMAWGRQ